MAFALAFGATLTPSDALCVGAVAVAIFNFVCAAHSRAERIWS